MPLADPSLALQKAFVAQLKADPAVAAIVAGRIYDGVPTPVVFPYVSLGPFQVLRSRGDCIDGAAVSIQIDGWAIGPGTVTAKQLGAAIAAALDDAELDLDAPHVIVSIACGDVLYQREQDGITVHAIVTAEAIAEPRD